MESDHPGTTSLDLQKVGVTSGDTREADMVPWVWPWRTGGGPSTTNQLCSQIFWGKCAQNGCSRLVPTYFEVAASSEAEVKGYMVASAYLY